MLFEAKRALLQDYLLKVFSICIKHRLQKGPESGAWLDYHGPVQAGHVLHDGDLQGVDVLVVAGIDVPLQIAPQEVVVRVQVRWWQGLENQMTSLTECPAPPPLRMHILIISSDHMMQEFKMEFIWSK